MVDKTLTWEPDYLTGKLNSSGNIPVNLRYPTGYFERSVMSMNVVRPSSNAVVAGVYSADHYGYVGRETQVYIAIQGGAFPYAPVLVSAPSGATIGTDPNAADYMILKYTPTANGSYSFSLKIFDQENTAKTIELTITVSTAWCVFISPTGNDTTGTGTKAAPWATISKAFSSTTGGKALIVEDGTYTNTTSNTLNNTTINSILGWSQRGAQIDLSASNGTAFFWGASNSIIQGVRFINPPTNVNNPKIISTSSTINNLHVDNCEFDINGRLGLLNDDNISCMFLGDSGTIRSKVSQTRCDFLRFAGAANGWSAIDIYRTHYTVIERNRFLNQISATTSGANLWVKGDQNRYVDVRRNYFDSSWSGFALDVYMGNDGGINYVTGDVDVSYNLLLGATGGIMVARGNTTGHVLPVWVRRNTVVNAGITVSARVADSTIKTVESKSDVVQTTAGTTDPFKMFCSDTALGTPRQPLSYAPYCFLSCLNYECHGDSGIVDAAGLLTGSYLTNYRGRRGHEVYKP